MVTFKEFFSFKNNRFFWLNLIAMVVVIVAAPLGTLQWLDNYTRHGEAVVVPDVKGMNLRIAENELDKQSLKSIVIDSSYVKGIAPGVILEQNPAGGKRYLPRLRSSPTSGQCLNRHGVMGRPERTCPDQRLFGCQEMAHTIDF